MPGRSLEYPGVRNYGKVRAAEEHRKLAGTDGTVIRRHGYQLRTADDDVEAAEDAVVAGIDNADGTARAEVGRDRKRVPAGIRGREGVIRRNCLPVTGHESDRAPVRRHFHVRRVQGSN